MSCKVKKGYQGNEVMRNKKQKTKLENNPKKHGWVKEEEEGKKPEGDSEVAGMPMIEIDGKSYVDIEQVLRSGQNYTPSGKPVYIPADLIPIREFKPERDTPEAPSWIAYGKRRTGKTFFVRWWMWYFRRYYWQVYCFSETLINGFWIKYFPEQACYPQWDEARAQQILDFNKWVLKNPEEAARHGYSGKTLTICDDVIANKLLRATGDDGVYAQLYVQGRHTKMSVGTCTQKATALPPKVRDNIDLVFILRQESDTERERIWKEHMGRLNRRTAYEMMELWTTTENYKTPQETRLTLIIDTDPCKSYNERFFWARAFDPGDFKMGTPLFRKEME